MLTFESIRDLERAEKDSKKMQKLPADFFEQLSEYLGRKRDIKDKSSTDIIESENVKNIVKRLLEHREKKLVEIVLMGVRTGLPPENLTKDEQKAFLSMTENIKHLRSMAFSCFEGQRSPRFRVKKDIPKFIGPDMKTYEFKEDQIADIPKPLSDFLLKEGFIEEIK